ncbi:MAG: GntR family transcriptional regulator [Chloroflexota bacterium]|nr:GntR family transcriptional regulator [Chloroflexota bacterium]
MAWSAASTIRAGVQEGRWRVGDRLPSEPQLAQDLGISRATLREALRLLISDGLLDRRHGVGTFVARVPTPTIERGIDELFSLTDALEQLGYCPSIGAHWAHPEAASAEMAAELRLAPGADVLHLRRTRLADGRPVILCDDYFPMALLARAALDSNVVGAEVAARGSLYAWLDERLGLSVDSALTRIEPATAEDEMARELRVPSGSALLRLRQTHYTADGSSVLYSESVHNSDVIHFHVVRRRGRTTQR